MKSKKFFAVLLVAVLAVGMVLAGCSSKKESEGSDLEYVQGKGTLIVGITDFAPMDYKDEKGNWIGFDADMAAAFAKELGVKVEFVEIDWDNKVMELDNKNIDVIWNGMTVLDELKASLDFSNAYMDNSQVIVVKSDVADFAKATYAVEKGSAGAEAAAEKKYKVNEVGSQADALLEVKSGTSDAAIIDFQMACSMTGEGTDYPELKIADAEALTSEQYGVGFRKGSDLVAKCNEFFAKTYKDGTMETIAVQYGMPALSLIEQK